MSDTEKPELRRANDNPWYCLATLNGEQPIPTAANQWGGAIAVNNRMAWNRWIAGTLSDEQRADLVKKGFRERDLAPLTPAEKSAFCSAFASRTGREKEMPPDPAGVADFTHTLFDGFVNFVGFLFLGADFSSATFSGDVDFKSATFFTAHFNSATFSKDVCFGKATFSDFADFSSSTFSGIADFSSSKFSAYAHFTSATFYRDTDFSGSTFYGAEFGKATFSCDASFSWATFSSKAEFKSATFSGNVDFTFTKISGGPDFRLATFSSKVEFNSATFSDADFNSATFSGSTNFSSATFSGNTNFRLATFSGFAFFASATFSDDADFRSTTFSDDAYFGSATYHDDAYFHSATFAGNADFNSVTFFDDADFNSVTFSGDANFRAVTFPGNADFINGEFTANTVFADVRFGTSVPDFRGAKMHEATEWHGVNWPSAPHDKDTAQTQVYAYERLKQEMERLKKHEDEQFFFRKELRARRGLARPGSGAWLLNYIYEVSSDYGQSIERPLVWLFVLFVSGSIFFSGTPVFKGMRMTMSGAAGLSFANIFSFLPLTREIMSADTVASLSRAAQIIGVVQSVLGALLLFLLGLALRTRFRMR